MFAPKEWTSRAKCAGIDDPDIFFPPRDKELYKLISDQAKAICLGKDGKPACPVRKECLIEAIESDEQHGIWGGLSPRERGAVKRKARNAGKKLEDYIS